METMLTDGRSTGAVLVTWRWVCGMLVQKVAVSRTRWVYYCLFDARGGPRVLLASKKSTLGHRWGLISTNYAAARRRIELGPLLRRTAPCI